MDDNTVCVIYLKEGDNQESTILSDIGAETINNCSRTRNSSVFASLFDSTCFMSLSIHGHS
jgi:hypothetical protein